MTRNLLFNGSIYYMWYICTYCVFTLWADLENNTFVFIIPHEQLTPLHQSLLASATSPSRSLSELVVPPLSGQSLLLPTTLALCLYLPDLMLQDLSLLPDPLKSHMYTLTDLATAQLVLSMSTYLKVRQYWQKDCTISYANLFDVVRIKGTKWAVFGGKRIHSTLCWKGSIVSAGIRTPDPWVAKRTIYHWAIWLADEWA